MAHKTPPITRAELLRRIAYNQVTGEFRIRSSRYKSYEGQVTGCYKKAKNGRMHYIVRIDGVEYSGAKLAYFYCRGVWPQERILHKDGNTANNAIGNLVVGGERGAFNQITPEWLRRHWDYDARTGRCVWRYGWCKGKKVGYVYTYRGQRYCRVKIAKSTRILHRLLWLYHYGEWPEGALLARDGDFTNLAISNFYYGEGLRGGSTEKKKQMEILNRTLTRYYNKLETDRYNAEAA